MSTNGMAPGANQSQPVGKSLLQIFGLLSTQYMRGKGLTQDEVMEVLKDMVMGGRVRQVDGRYF